MLDRTMVPQGSLLSQPGAISYDRSMGGSCVLSLSAQWLAEKASVCPLSLATHPRPLDGCNALLQEGCLRRRDIFILLWCVMEICALPTIL